MEIRLPAAGEHRPTRRQLGFMRTKGIASGDPKDDFADDINTIFGC